MSEQLTPQEKIRLRYEQLAEEMDGLQKRKQRVFDGPLSLTLGKPALTEEDFNRADFEHEQLQKQVENGKKDINEYTRELPETERGFADIYLKKIQEKEDAIKLKDAEHRYDGQKRLAEKKADVAKDTYDTYEQKYDSGGAARLAEKPTKQQSTWVDTEISNEFNKKADPPDV